jgi:hypothetical protein
MPLRTRLRRALTGADGKSKTATTTAKHTEAESDFYLPGEKMPQLKYRRPVDPEHKERLEAFSFKTAWRRRSQSSLYSPMGSRLPSRRGSFRSRRSRSRSMARSRRSSVSASSDYDPEETWVDSGIGASIDGDERPAGIREASDDEGDVLNGVYCARSVSECGLTHHSWAISQSHRRPSRRETKAIDCPPPVELDPADITPRHCM